jgi:FkbM family methyltransferase
VVFRLFGLVRTLRARWSRKVSKKWHGPLWKRIASPLLGTRERLTVRPDGLPLYIRPNQINDLIALFGRPEEEFVADMVASLGPGDVFVDAGAYIGQYSVQAAGCVGSQGAVVAVEPDTDNFRLLQRNVEANANGCVRLVKGALGHQDGTVEITTVPDDSALCTLSDTWVDELYPDEHLDTQAQTVPLMTIATTMRELGLDHIDLLKVDVEGAEVQVFEGARDCLRSGQIRRIICELHGNTAPRVKALLEECGYRIEFRPQHLVAWHPSHSPSPA